MASEMQRRKMTTPLLIGGATTSAKHTAVKIAPVYENAVVHVLDASRSASVAGQLINPARRGLFESENRASQQKLVEAFESRGQAKLVPYREAVAKRFPTDWGSQPIAAPSFTGVRLLDDYPLDELAGYIDWSPLFWAWEIRGMYPKILDHPERGQEARKLFHDAQNLLELIVQKKLLHARGVYGFWPAASEVDDIVLFGDRQQGKELARVHALRQQWSPPGRDFFYSLADFIAPVESGRTDYLGAFAVSAGFGTAELAASFQLDHDDYNSIMAKVLADRLAEAFAERLHQIARTDWSFGRDENLSKEDLLKERYRGIRPAPGYPACPDHSQKQTLFDLMNVEQSTGIRLTESMMMVPEAAVCGWYFSHPESRYFSVNQIMPDQVRDYARRRGIELAEAKRCLAANLADES